MTAAWRARPITPAVLIVAVIDYLAASRMPRRNERPRRRGTPLDTAPRNALNAPSITFVPRRGGPCHATGRAR
ncbi:MAG: hypothetical protein AVDCRST_MAG88-4215 [uncultured Thermomicrobiales bacterium]|uniref:Uncharacterized protein n=1 Tax=uncultured Thermomicrobiales bacterium TaxID=1645740 RepID=A0A6J4VWE5_9BACT|nr:MAG: hypothetical protein AVDCRST_MAG88-4215 [uncultured Thermomicrobiales bacterium]